MNPKFIAEIKTQSPFGYKSEDSFVVLMDYAIKYGDWISVHTNALWGGDYDAISFVRKNTNKPILAKGIHGTDDDISRALDHGATYVLVVDRYPDPEKIHPSNLLYEISNFELLKHNLRSTYYLNNCKFVCNSRNLSTGLPYMKWVLPEYFEKGLWTCQASNIKTPNDVDKQASAFIVGTHLIDFCKHL